MSVDVATLTPDDFAPLLDTGFALQAVDVESELRLADIRRLGPALREGCAFSLLFVSRDAPLPQATYALAHPKLGRLEIFLVPIGPVQGGRGYEAVFT